MTRTALFQLTVIILLVCGAVAGLLWWYVQQAEVRLGQLNITLNAKQAELANLSQMTEAQEKLDMLTFDERETTQLALLRHLGLEDVTINFQVMSREARPSGDTTLITRVISLQMVNGYAEQMALLDNLFGNGKIQINKVTMMRAETPEISDPADMTVEGIIYSLEKTLVEPPANTPATTPPTETVTPEPTAPSMVEGSTPPAATSDTPADEEGPTTDDPMDDAVGMIDDVREANTPEMPNQSEAQP
jgi:hypothetical protein